MYCFIERGGENVTNRKRNSMTINYACIRFFNHLLHSVSLRPYIRKMRLSLSFFLGLFSSPSFSIVGLISFYFLLPLLITTYWRRYFSADLYIHEIAALDSNVYLSAACAECPACPVCVSAGSPHVCAMCALCAVCGLGEATASRTTATSLPDLQAESDD